MTSHTQIVAFVFICPQDSFAHTYTPLFMYWNYAVSAAQ